MNRKLYRSRNDKMLGGVCGGLGDYLGIDPIFVRLFFVFFTLGQGFGVLLYVVLWILVPEEPAGEVVSTGGFSGDFSDEFSDRVQAMGEDVQTAIRQPHPQAGLIIGGSLIIFGVIALVNSLDIRWLDWVNYDIVWPVLLIAGGVIWMLRGRQKGAGDE